MAPWLSLTVTPRYDALSLWPVIGSGPNLVAWPEAKLAMAVRSKNVHCELARIQARHWRGLAQRSGAGGVWEAMQALVDRVQTAIATVQRLLPAGFPERTARTIFDGLRRSSQALEAGLTGLVSLSTAPLRTAASTVRSTRWPWPVRRRAW